MINLIGNIKVSFEQKTIILQFFCIWKTHGTAQQRQNLLGSENVYENFMIFQTLG